jgi:diguanylate cyclase (GGDEF)-like protein
MRYSSIAKKLFWSMGLPGLVLASFGLLYFWQRADSTMQKAAEEQASAFAELLANQFQKSQGHHREVIQWMGSQPQLFATVQHLRIADAHGVVRYSLQREEEGAPTSQLPGLSSARGAEVSVLLGGEGCGGCHGSSKPELGKLTVTLAEPSLHAEVSSVFRAALVSLVLLAFVLTAAAALSLRAFLGQRLHRLMNAMQKAEEGDFVARADESGDDEIARLAGAFNHMLAKLTELKVSEIDTQRDLAFAQEQLQLKAALEESNSQLQKRLGELSLLSDVARSLTSTLELTELLERITQLLTDRLGLPRFTIMLMGAAGDLEVKSAHPPHDGAQALPFPVGEGACGRAAQTLQPVYVADLGDLDNPYIRRSSSPNEGSLLCIPMVHGDLLLGVLNFQRPTQNAFTKEEMSLFSAVADQAALAVKNALLHAQMVALSTTDPLTGAPNRRHLFNRLEMEIARASRFGNPVSLLMIDIDHFKNLNDSKGHRAGDTILRQVYELMRGMTRKVDTLARYGGEEFILLLPQVPSAEAVEVAEKLRRAVADTAFVYLDALPALRVTISVGVASLPTDAGTLETLVDSADSALYASKRAGRNAVTAYAPGMEDHPGRQRDLRTARQLTSA